jgi:Zn-finger protein
MSNFTSNVVDEAKSREHVVSGEIGCASYPASITRVDCNKCLCGIDIELAKISL